VTVLTVSRRSGAHFAARDRRQACDGTLACQVHSSDEAEVKNMGLLTKPIKTLDDLFVHMLQDIYYAEQQITKALPKMIAQVTNPELKQAFESHLTETKNQVTRVERVFQMHGQPVKAVTCQAIDGIIEEANDILGDAKDSEVIDAAAAAAAQAVEHYEIARYGTLIAWARELGRDDCASVLEQTLAEEKAADQKLTDVAEGRLNRMAAQQR
jgi:ferritin-like metal-binding protein YciE